eukprot:1444970-Prymnesium_polylepis.1
MDEPKALEAYGEAALELGQVGRPPCKHLLVCSVCWAAARNPCPSAGPGGAALKTLAPCRGQLPHVTPL